MQMGSYYYRPSIQQQPEHNQQQNNLFRNTTEELLIKSFVDEPIAAPENMGFLAPSSTARVNSEELFNSWISNSENPGLMALKSGRISSELSALLAHQQHGPETYASGDTLEKNAADKKNGYTKSAYPSLQILSWFQPSQPMTRSRSSELRKRYIALQQQQPSQGFPITSLLQDVVQGNLLKPANKPQNLIPPSLNMEPRLQHPQQRQEDKVSAVVSMLKGSLEKRKHAEKQQQYICTTNDVVNNSELGVVLTSPANSFLENSRKARPEDLIIPSSPTDSCGPTPAEDQVPCHSASNVQHHQSRSIADQPMNQDNFSSPSSAAYGTICNNDFQFESVQAQQIQPNLSRAGSITSTGKSAFSGERDGDTTTKKRRVERKRMMVEAKGRSKVPLLPSDLQTVVKRCDALEKEVRSLKLNLSFMNRKDSEQTKRIEELEKQNEELAQQVDEWRSSSRVSNEMPTNNNSNFF